MSSFCRRCARATFMPLPFSTVAEKPRYANVYVRVCASMRARSEAREEREREPLAGYAAVARDHKFPARFYVICPGRKAFAFQEERYLRGCCCAAPRTSPQRSRRYSPTCGIYARLLRDCSSSSARARARGGSGIAPGTRAPRMKLQSFNARGRFLGRDLRIQSRAH